MNLKIKEVENLSEIPVLIGKNNEWKSHNYIYKNETGISKLLHSFSPSVLTGTL